MTATDETDAAAAAHSARRRAGCRAPRPHPAARPAARPRCPVCSRSLDQVDEPRLSGEDDARRQHRRRARPRRRRTGRSRRPRTRRPRRPPAGRPTGSRTPPPAPPPTGGPARPTWAQEPTRACESTIVPRPTQAPTLRYAGGMIGHARLEVDTGPDGGAARHDAPRRPGRCRRPGARAVEQVEHAERRRGRERRRSAVAVVAQPGSAEAQQDALLHPGVDAPAAGRGRIGLGGADLARLERRHEVGRRPPWRRRQLVRERRPGRRPGAPRGQVDPLPRRVAVAARSSVTLAASGRRRAVTPAARERRPETRPQLVRERQQRLAQRRPR